ncbi:MAG: T9SS type A sorting domain-containing protein [bacterium]
MRRIRHALRLFTVALVVPSLVPVAAFASWALDGNRVVDLVAQAVSPVLVPSDSGEVFMAWIDARSGYNTDVRATLWGARGLPHAGWSASGDLVTAVTCAKYDLAGTPDGSGGAFLSWSDNRCVGYRNVYLGHVPRTGLTGFAWPTNGVRCAATTQDQNLSAVVADGSGGAFVAWEDVRNGEADVYMQHVDVDAHLVAGWPVAGLAVASAAGRQEKPAPESLTVDVTPRRTQRFRPAVGQRVAWRVTRLSDGALLQSDTVTVDALGRVTVPGARVRSGGTRLVLQTIAGVLAVPGQGGAANLLLAPFVSPTRTRAELAGTWAQSGPAELALYDVTGRRTRTWVSGPVTAGPWRVTADLGGLGPGVYLVRAEQAGVARTRRLILLR